MNSTDTVLGIDPGISGALAVVTTAGDLVDVFDMPILRYGAKGRSTVNAPLLAAIIRETGATTALVEFVGARPGEGAVGAFAFGRCEMSSKALPPLWESLWPS